MESKYGFTKMTLSEFKDWIKTKKVARHVLRIQQHHTYIPNYKHFNGTNHFERQKSMKNSHLQRQFNDIGQHFTSFPDGTILTGRSLEKNPACIKGANNHSICIEHLGNFDPGGDAMTVEQQKTVVEMTAALCSKFGLAVNTDKIIYHHWFHLGNGSRNNGGPTTTNKTCPGRNFFGGNKVEDCKNNFLPLVSAAMAPPANDGNQVPIKYAMVTADSLNIRSDAHFTHPIVPGSNPATFGSVLRVYEEKDGWYRISGSSAHWVSGKHTLTVRHAVVNVASVDLQDGLGLSFDEFGTFTIGQDIFIEKLKGNWAKLGMEDRWISRKFIDFQEN